MTAQIESVLDEVTRIVAEVLCLELDEVTPDSRFFQDLNGESIEMLELSFMLDRRYGMTFRLQQLVPTAELDVDEAGRLTATGLASLRQQCPFLNVTAIADDPCVDRLSELVTIDAIAQAIHRAMQSAIIRTQPHSLIDTAIHD